MAPLEPWEKVLIAGDTYPDTVHGQIACIDCHRGEQSADKEVAHSDLVPNPSSDPEATCGECHPDVVAMSDDSLHTNLEGYWTILNARSAPEGHEAISKMFGNHCASCHATCGECHVSQPAPVGGGLIDGHNFNETPSMTRNCTACHGSRVGNEYLGKNEDLRGDVHFRQGRMTCVDCHGGHDVHGQPQDCQTCHVAPEESAIPPPDHRYTGVQSPSCESCHVTASTGQDDVEMHQAHGADLSCQVCHSIDYKSCDGCHVALSDETGNPFFETDGSYLSFLIGLNPLRSFERPYKYVPLRHVPIAHDSFAFYGDDLLENYDALPTWVYATPHNIQLETPQTEDCNACHGNPDIFLTADKVDPVELNANLPVIVDSIPGLVLPDGTIEQTEIITTTSSTEGEG